VRQGWCGAGRAKVCSASGAAIAFAALIALGIPTPAAAQQGQAAAVQSLINAGIHPDLRRPSFAEDQDQLRSLYEPEGFAPLWVCDGAPTAQAAAVVAVLANADADGLDAADYDAALFATEGEQLRTAGEPSAERVARFDVALTVALMRYISDSSAGRVNPRLLGYQLDFEPKKIDLPALVLELSRSDNPAQRLAGLDPPVPVYGILQQALTRYRALAGRSDLPPVPTLPKLHPGEADPGVPALRVWLKAYGDLPEGARVPGDAKRYDPALVAAMKQFQHRHGLDPDGVIGASTLHALQIPPSQRVRQIELAMERLRWLPSQLPERFVLVNIPEFRLRGFADAAPRVDMGVVVGSSADKTETPVLQADMRYLIFRPSWLVPSSIAKKEILPKADRDPSYLTRQNMELVNGRLRQKPGPNNSLGLLKFILPNPYHVYLHDTPSKALFRRSRRDFSHGCIRVADPPALAEFVLEGQTGWDRQRIEDAMKSGPDNHRVDLRSPVPVYVFYSTAGVDRDGQIAFFDDIYGHDATLETLLAKGHPRS